MKLRPLAILLRHPHNPRALSRNPLVAGLFAFKGLANDAPVVLRVHDIVENAIESLKTSSGAGMRSAHVARQHAIITRYDIAGRSLHLIADDLQIRTSRFYYERRAALGRLAQAVRSAVAAPNEGRR